ncbi:MAG: 3-deoxy-D-manno-octulosonic acid transferase [Deltaproteobacteria bacterium]|nr:3-deoxy-D-manno-octulosonic acid transferase [Deltaproteobacteria bacterium]
MPVNALLTCLWPFVLLYFRLRAATDGKYAITWRGRLGLEMPHLGNHPRRLWVHALSVGETLSAVPLVQALKAENPSFEIVFSTSTETGRVIARKNLDPHVTECFIMPLDFPWAVNRLVERVAPRAFVLVETDVWPNMVNQCRRRGIPVFLVNGRISDSSFGKLRWFRRLTKGMFGSLHQVFAQTLTDKAKYELLGVPAGRVRAAGNLKVDSVLPPLSEKAVAGLRASAGVEPERPVWIAGSTHEGEEELLLQVHERLMVKHPDLLLIVAPREVRRAGELASAALEHGFAPAFRSRGESAHGRGVYFLDTLGELSRFYALARVAFIGGSLVPLGGHNPLEATAQGKFAVWGPHLFNFRELESQLVLAGCGAKVSSGEELEEILTRFLADAAPGRRAESDARRFFAAHTGPSRTIAREILSEWGQGIGEQMP